MSPLGIALLSILAAIIMIVLAIRYGKLFFHVFAVFAFLIFITIIIFVAVIVNDISSLENGYADNNNVFILEKDDFAIATLILKPQIRRTGSDVYRETIINASTRDFLDKGKLDVEKGEPGYAYFRYPSEGEYLWLKQDFDEYDYDNLTKPFFMMYIFDLMMFENFSSEIIEIAEYELTLSEAITVLEAPIPLRKAAEIISVKEIVPIEEVEAMLFKVLQFYETTDIRGYLFDAMLDIAYGTEVETLGPLDVYFEFDSILAYPPTIFFDFADTVPKWLISDVSNGLEE